MVRFKENGGIKMKSQELELLIAENCTTKAQIVDAVFAKWQEVFGKNRARMNAKRKKKIEERIKEGYTYQDMAEAIMGCSLTPWNMGDNPSRKRYVELELILRDGSQLERFRDTYTEPPVQVIDRSRPSREMSIMDVATDTSWAE